jgi:hypothetical protein
MTSSFKPTGEGEDDDDDDDDDDDETPEFEPLASEKDEPEAEDLVDADEAPDLVDETDATSSGKDVGNITEINAFNGCCGCRTGCGGGCDSRDSNG